MVVVGVGEVLWDLLPGGKQFGGACANFTYHAQTLGAEAWLVSRVGDDPLGHEILERLSGMGLRADGVTVDPCAPTGTVSVELSRDGQPKFTIRENVAWDHIVPTHAAKEAVARADAVCFGSLAQRSEASRETIRSLVTSTRPEALRIFDVNLRQPFYTLEIIESSLRLANVLKINDEELPVLAGFFGLRGSPTEQLAQLALRYHLRMVALTRGARGSLLYADGRTSDHPGSSATVVDTVGAGDAFTAALTMGLLANWDLDTLNHRASQIASYVVSQPGGTPKMPDRLRFA